VAIFSRLWHYCWGKKVYKLKNSQYSARFIMHRRVGEYFGIIYFLGNVFTYYSTWFPWGDFCTGIAWRFNDVFRSRWWLVIIHLIVERIGDICSDWLLENFFHDQYEVKLPTDFGVWCIASHLCMYGCWISSTVMRSFACSSPALKDWELCQDFLKWQ